MPSCESVHCCHKHDESEGKENKVTYSKALKTSGHQLTDDLHFRLYLHLTVLSLLYNTAQLEATAIVIWCYFKKKKQLSVKLTDTMWLFAKQCL